jgi:GT2 family glycosyltransferase
MIPSHQVSIVICFYERIRHLRACLDALRLHSGVFGEVVIADDGSSPSVVDHLRQLIPDYDYPIRHLWRPKDGFRLAETRNRGILGARGKYLIFLDCDFVVLPGTLEMHLQCARRGRFVLSGYKYLDPEQTERAMNGPLNQELIGRLDREIPGDDLVATQRKFWLRQPLFRLRLISARKQTLGGFFSIHRQDIERVNGYDENFVGWGGEDEDLGIRLVRKGVFCIPRIHQARALHLWHPKELGSKSWRQGPNIEYFSQPNKPAFCRNGLVKPKR